MDWLKSIIRRHNHTTIDQLEECSLHDEQSQQHDDKDDLTFNIQEHKEVGFPNDKNGKHLQNMFQLFQDALKNQKKYSDNPYLDISYYDLNQECVDTWKLFLKEFLATYGSIHSSRKRSDILGYPKEVIRLICVYFTEVEPQFSEEILNTKESPSIPYTFRVMALLTPIHSVQLLNHFNALTPILKVTNNMLTRLNLILDNDTIFKVSLDFEMSVFQTLHQIFYNFTSLRAIKRQGSLKALFVEIVSLLVDLSNTKRGGIQVLKVVHSYIELIGRVGCGDYLNGEVCCKLFGWPLRFDWSFDSKCTDLTLPVLESEIEREYAQIYYDIQMSTLRTIAQEAKHNSKLLHSLYKSGFIERMEEMGLWISVFFHNWKTTESETIIATLRDNSTPNLFLNVRSFDSSNQHIEWYCRPPIANHVPDLPSLNYPCPGFITKITNESYLSYWTLVTDFLALEGGSDDFINLIFNFWRGFDSDAKKKLRTLSDFQFYFLDKIFLSVSSTPHILEPFIVHGLYDILFSEYFYFFQFPLGKSDNIQTASQVDDDLYSEASDLQKMTAVILRDAVLSFIKYVATRGSSNIKELRKLTELLHEYSAQPVILSELGACLLDICYHQMEITQIGFHEMKGISIVSHVIDSLQSKIAAIERQKRPRSTIDDAVDAEIGSAIALNPLHIKMLHARNTLLYLFDVLMSNEMNQLLALEDVNALKCLFKCLFDPHLSDFVLSHLRRLLNTRVDDASAFENILNRLISGFPNMVQEASRDKSLLQLLMRTLEMMQDVFKGPNKKILQSQMRSKLDSFIFMLNFRIGDNAMVTQHDLCIQVMKTLICLLADNEKSKEFLRESIGYDSLKEMILMCESNRPTGELFNELFNMLVDGNFDLDSRYKIANSGTIKLMFQLCEHCPDSFVASFLTQFLAVIQKCTHNRNVCCSVNLISVLLDMIPRYDDATYFVDSTAMESSRKSITNRNQTGILNLLINLIEELGKHSITVAELKAFFALIRKQSDKVHSVRLLSLLLQSLHTMTTNEPQSFFDFDGTNSGMTLPKVDSRIFGSSRPGYSFTFWVRIESFEGRHSPRIISLVGQDNLGVEIYFEKQLLRVSAGKNVATFDAFRFEPKTWYFVSVVHCPAKGGFPFTSKSDMQLYINGRCVHKQQIKLASNLNNNKPLKKCRIGTRYASGDVHTMHFTHHGQMASIYLFGDALSSSVIRGIYLMGPNYGGSFHPTDKKLLYENTLGKDREDIDVSGLFDGSLSQRIVFCYSPSAQHQHSRTVVNNVPMAFYYQQYVQNSLLDPQQQNQFGDQDALYIVSHPAKLEPGTQLCVTRNISDIISCLGGLKILFPLFLQIDQLSHSADQSPSPFSSTKNSKNINLVNSLIELILHLLRDSHDNQEDMARGHGFQVIGFLLKQISPTHLTEETVVMIPKLLNRVREHEVLYTDAMQYILYDLRLWIYTKPDIQKKFFMHLIHDAEELEDDSYVMVSEFSKRSRFRAVIGVQRIVDLMRWLYWFDRNAETDLILGTEKIANPVTGAILGERPSQLGVGEIRSFLFRLLKTMIKGSGEENAQQTLRTKKRVSVGTPQEENVQQMLVLDRISSAELQALLHFLADCKDIYQLVDMTQFVLEIMLSNQGSTIAEDMNSLGAYEVFVSLLYVPEEKVRILALKCLGRLLLVNMSARKKTSADTSSGFSFIVMLLETFWFTEGVYRVLRDMFLGKVFLMDQGSLLTSIQQGGDKVKKLNTTSSRLELPAPLRAIFKLLPHSRPDVRLILLQDLKMHCEILEVQHLILEQPGWQTWILDLLRDDGSALLLKETDEYDEGDDYLPNTDSKIKVLTKCFEVMIDILGLVLYHSLTDIKQGWRHLEETFSYLFIYEERRYLADTRSLISAILSRILDHYQNAVTRKTITISLSDKNSPVLENLLHFATFTEEALFYTHTVNMQMRGVNWLKRVDSSVSLIPSALGVIKGMVVRDNTSTPVSAPTSEPPSPRSVISNASVSSVSTPIPLSKKFSEADFGSMDFNPNTPFTTGESISRSVSPSTSPPHTELHHTDSMRRLRKSSSAARIYDPEHEIQQRRDFETHQWLDLPIAQRLIHVLKQFNLAGIANFNALGNMVQGSKRLRGGGSVRLALRLIRNILHEADSIQQLHLDTVRMINKRDVENEKEIQKFSELWAVTGDLEEADDFVTRLLYMLAFLFDALGRSIDKGSTEEALMVYQCIKELFISRRKLLETKLLLDDKKPILKSNSPFFNLHKNSLDEYKELLKDKAWNTAWKKYFVPAVRKVEDEEAQFLIQLIKRRQLVHNTVYNQITQSENFENEFKRSQLSQLQGRIEQMRATEHQRALSQRAKYDEYDVIGSHLWKRTIQNVADQRGPWGKEEDNSSIRWKLDKAHNGRKMRLRLKRDYSPVDHTGAAQHSDKQRGGHSSRSNDQKHEAIIPDTYRNELLQIKGELGSFFIPKLAIMKDEASKTESAEEEEEESKITLEEDELLFAHDKVIVEVYCEMITAMQAFSGRLEITKKRLMWYGDKENQCVMFGVNEETTKLQKKPKDKIWKLDTIQEIHPRRYRLRSSAIEIFLTDHTSIFLNFNTKDRNMVYKKILQTKPPNLILVHLLSSPSDNLSRSGITKMWTKGQLSNFDYLMLLNMYAGRTYNDLSQYPIFPWIIRDYTSDTLDLDDPNIYRNLSLPVGALNENRHEDLKMRYEVNLGPDIPPFHYGSHYSSPGIVLYFLVRMEPYTTYFRILQGGKFDLPDRMFDSVPQTFENLLHSSDFKELIPEFYYNPDFLRIHNNVDLGTRQNGRRLGNAILPPWAKSNEEFVRINRAALESDYVSQNLHNWIDLIFGYKQKGPEAVKALNVFFHLTYEENCNIDACEDPERKRSIIAQIENFGQTPSQLFTTPHPKREISRQPRTPLSETEYVDVGNDTIKDPLVELHVSPQLSKQVTPNKMPLVYIKLLQNSTYNNPRLCLISQDGLVYIGKMNSTSHPLFPSAQSVQNLLADPTFASAQNCRSIGFPLLLPQKKTSHRKSKFDESALLLKAEDSNSLQLTSQCFAVPMFVNKDQDIPVFSCFHWDHSVRLSKPFATANPLSSVKVSLCPQIAMRRHKDRVTCCAVCKKDETLVTGSRDTTVIIWDIRDPQQPIQNHILYGHDDMVTCLAVDSDLDTVLSGSQDGTCIMHSLQRGNYIRTIKHPNNHPIGLIAIANVEQSFTIAGKVNPILRQFSEGYTSTLVGHVVIYSPVDCVLHLFNMNGEHLVQREMDKSDSLNVLITWDCTYAIAGGDSGMIYIIRLLDLQIVRTYDLKDWRSRIRSLCVADDGTCIFVGLEDGKLVVLHHDISNKQLAFAQ